MENQGEGLRKQLKEEFIQRLTARFLDLIIMGRFRNEPFSNYDAHKFVQDEFGLKISSGTIHSTIYGMERKRLVTSLTMNGKRVYRLTDRGKMTVEVATSPEEIATFVERALGRGGFHAAGLKAKMQK